MDDRYKIIRHKVREMQTQKIWADFEKAGFEPILIKGWAAAQVYPQPYEREFVDVDLMVPPGKFEAARRFASELNAPGLPVDLHSGARHLDTLSFEELFADSRIVQCGASEVRVLRDEDHLRILCVHWLNDGGADREKLRDIYYAVANRDPETFDWDRLLSVVSPKRRRWIVCAVGLAHRYLNLDVEDTPIGREAKEIPAWLSEAVEREWRSGVKLLPLHFFLNDKKALWEQVKKRIPPNPVQATVELEGDFDDRPRIFYQLKNVWTRLMPSIRRLREAAAARK